MTGVRQATMADVPRLTTTLARAFEDDPVMRFLLSDHRYQQRLRGFFTLELKYFHLHHGITFTTHDHAGAAVWAPPGEWRIPFGTQARGLVLAVRIFGRRLLRSMRTLSVVEGKRPKEPHYYLAVLGTEPNRQGQGIGSALLNPVLQRCDQEGIGAYLESSKERNVPYYRRHGFEVTEEITLPNGPPLWLMWRDPVPDIPA